MEAGELFGRYRLEQRLGAGGLADVWRATDTLTEQTVALKRFSGTLSSSDSERLRADVELLAAHALRGHPNVVEVYAGGPEPAPHVVMEYLDAGDLGREIADHGPRSVARTMEVGVAVAQALRAASEAGVTHGDVKPSNVLLGSDGAIKLGDFNVARVIGYTAGSMSGTLILSFAYAAPEVWDGRPSASSDLYAFGCVLFECLTGKPPFTGSYAEVFRAHLEKAPDLDALPPETPVALRRLIGDLLAKDPAARPPDPQAVLERLAAIRGDVEAETGARLPAAFGPWVIQSPHPVTRWAWRARHAQTGKQATVELFFGDHSVGEQIRRAVAVNAQLVPFGAERLLESNRLLLRPGETFGRPTPPGWIFWVARDEVDLPPVAPVLDGAALERSVDHLQRLLGAAAGVRLALDLSRDNVVILTDGAVHVRRPGLATGPVDPEAGALALLRERAAPSLASVVAAAASLGALSTALGRAATATQSVRAATVQDAPTAVVPRQQPALAPRAAAEPPSPRPLVPAAGAPGPPIRSGIRRETRDRPSGGGAGLVAALLLALGVLLVGIVAFVGSGGLDGDPGPTLPAIGAATDPPTLLTATPADDPSPEATDLLTPITEPTPELPPTAEPATEQPAQPTDEPPPPTEVPPPAVAWEVDIESSQASAQNGERVQITASANRNVGPSAYYIQIYNPDTGFIHRQCGGGSTCSVGARRENITAPYRARISNADGGDVQAVSERIEVTWSGGTGNTQPDPEPEPQPEPQPQPDPEPGWDVTIASSQQEADNGERVQITASANRTVAGSPWFIQVFNPDTGFIHWSCGTSATCGGGARRENITAPYQARISAADGSNVQAQSGRITVTWR